MAFVYNFADDNYHSAASRNRSSLEVDGICGQYNPGKVTIGNYFLMVSIVSRPPFAALIFNKPPGEKLMSPVELQVI